MRAPLIVLFATAGCYVGLTDASPQGAAEGGTDGAHADDGAVDDGGDDDDGPVMSACGDLPDEADPLRRLTAAELFATVETIVGVPIPADVRAWMPSDLREDAFSNAAESLVVQSAHTEAVLRIAEWARAAVFTDVERRAAFVGCEPSDPQCLTDYIARVGRLAYRRSLRDEEIERLHAVALASADSADPDDPWAAFGIVLEALLQSPKFLLRPEVGVPTGDGRLRLAGPELATRLAFALWGVAPDAALLDRAEAGELDDTEGVRTVAQDMLDDPRALQGLGSLAQEWFLLPKLDVAQIDVTRFPELTPSLRAAMRAEVEQLIADHMFGDVAFLGLYVSEHAQVTPELAELYGVEFPPGWQADTGSPGGTLTIEFSPEDDRGGLLGRAGFLAMGAESWFASPVRRGLNVRTAALCDRPPPPPADVEMTDPEGEDAEDAFDQHSADPACAGCHSLLDPVGHGLDRYDAIGRLRDVDESGDPVREDGMVAGIDPGAFSGARELGELVAEAPQTSHCAVTRASDWLLARTAGDATACVLAEIESDALPRDFRFRDLVLALVTSEPFTLRTIDGQEEGGP